MTIDLQFKLKSNPNYLKYLHENSYWYKLLNRNPKMIDNFIEKLKEDYHLRTTDKLSDALNAIDMLSRVMSTLK